MRFLNTKIIMLHRLKQALIPHRIRHQVGLVFALLLALTLFTLGYFLISQSESAVKDSVLRDYRELTLRTSREISTFIDKPRDLLINTACMMGMLPYADAESQKALIYRLITDYPELFKRVGFAGLDGKEIFSTEWDNPPKDYSAMDFFKEISSTGKAVISKVYFSDEGFPYLKVAVSVKQLDKTAGFLVAQAKLNHIWQLVADIKTAGEDAYLVDEEGYALAHNEEKKVYRGDNLKHLLSVRNVLEGKSGSLEESYQGNQWLSAYAPVEPFGWGLIIHQPTAAAYAFSLRMQKTAGIIILLAILIAVLFSIMIARWITNPVKELVEMADKVASGDLEHTIKISRRDEIGKLVKAFNEMIGRLKKARHAERLSDIGVAASKIAHELRNPLVAIKTAMQLLPERHNDAKFIREFEGTVPGEMARLEKMLAMMTDFSSDRKLALAECNVALLIKSTLDLFKEPLAANNIRVEINTDYDNINIRIDADKIKQVLINLIQNAVDAMANKLNSCEKVLKCALPSRHPDTIGTIVPQSEAERGHCEERSDEAIPSFPSKTEIAPLPPLRRGSGTPDNKESQNGATLPTVARNDREGVSQEFSNKGKLKIGVKQLPEKTLEIRVADTGCGMDGEQVANAFEPFYTSKRGGLGLGLAICKELIEQHKGTIEVTSEKEKGTVFIIKLPLEN
jgi:signal transduction histidine kinase